jgi:hypothetical protein
MKESLEKMLGLALGFALLCAHALEASDGVNEFLLECKRGTTTLRKNEKSV